MEQQIVVKKENQKNVETKKIIFWMIVIGFGYPATTICKSLLAQGVTGRELSGLMCSFYAHCPEINAKKNLLPPLKSFMKDASNHCPVHLRA